MTGIICFVLGLNLLGMGIIGEYTGKIYMENIYGKYIWRLRRDPDILLVKKRMKMNRKVPDCLHHLHSEI